MFTRQDNPTDERRRRLLQEEVSTGARRGDGEGNAGKARGKHAEAARYSPAAELDRQPRLTDLVPARLSLMALWFFIGALVVAGLETLYYYMPAIGKHATDGRVAALDLDGEGSLAAYFSSLVLAAAGLAAIIVYTLRRHRLDDYRGRYRVWLWAAICWFVMSIDESGSLHEGFKELVSRLSGKRLLGDGSVWWAMSYALVLAVVGSYLLVEMRRCWSSTASLFLAGGCYGVAVATQLQFLLPDRGARGVMLEEGCEMAGNLFLLLSMALHARYVIRDVQGLIAHPEEKAEEIIVKRRRATKKKENESKESEYLDEDSSSTPAASAAAAKLESRPQFGAIAAKNDAGPTPSFNTLSAKTPPGPAAAAKPLAGLAATKPLAGPTPSKFQAGPAPTKPLSSPPKAETKPALRSGSGQAQSEAKPAATTSSWFSRALGLGKSESAKTEPAKSEPARPASTGSGQKSSQLRTDPPEDDDSPRKLSKAERKAMKRMHRLERDEE